MPHDIIDNRDQKLLDHINRILRPTESACTAKQQFICHSTIHPFVLTNHCDP